MPRFHPSAATALLLAAAIATALVAPALGAPPPQAPQTPPSARPAPAPAPRAPTAPPTPKPRWTDKDADAMVKTISERALVGSSTESAQLSALAIIASIGDRAAHETAERTIRAIAVGKSVTPEVRGEAALLARTYADDEGTKAGVEKARAAGILTEVSILGPSRDTGGGLDAHDGPEEKKAAFGDPANVYSWGTVEVAWRPVPAEFSQARGLPLDLFIHPRKESCTFVASKLKLPAAKVIVVRLAASGQARLVFDGVDAGKSDEVHALGRFDRLAAKVDAPPGMHIVAAKVCTGALEDVGRVRLRVTDVAGAPLEIESSADLRLDQPVGWGKAKVERVPTALERALKPASDVDALLESAVVRTLAGADDMKSPRAPGQIDAILQRKDLDADRLAVAAWVTPSGASRSARYFRARDAATNDERTRGFVQRRLVEHHLDTDMTDWAIASFRGAKIDAASDDEALLLRARIARSLRLENFSMQATRTLGGAFRAGKDRVSDAVLLELDRLAREHDVALWLDVAQELARRGLRGELLVDAMGARGKEAVVRAAKDAFVGGMDDVDEALGVARHVADAGAHDVAAMLYRQLGRWAPNRPEAWSGLAREIAIASPKDKDLVLVALRRARELDPGDAKYRAELALRVGAHLQKNPAAEEHEDERYIAPTATVLARRGGVPKGVPDVADRELYWLRAVRMHDDNRVSQLIHYAREIVIAPRTQGELFEPIPPEGDLVEIVRARVHKRAGGIAFPVEEHNEGSRPRIRWPDLEPGDIVEVVVREWTSTAVGGRGDAPFYFRDYAGAPASHPLLYNEVVVETTPGHPLYVDVLHDNLAPYKRTETDERGVHVVRLVWDKPLVVPEEPLAPSMSETSPVIVGSTFKSWADFRKWYAEAVRGFTEPDEEVRRIAADLTKGKKSRDEKLRAIFEFVADDIRYVNYVSGEWWLPNRPQQLLARREGDCDDKALLLITLLRSVGIEAQEVMVQTRLTGEPSILLGKNAAVPQFDHGIAFLPGPNGGMYLDATSPQSRLGPIPSMDARAVALRMDAGPAEIIQLPASSPEDHGSDVNWTIDVHPDGSGELSGEERHSGDAAFWLRSNLGEAEARAQYVEDALVSPWFPTVDVDKKIDFKGDLPRGQATVKYHAKSRGLARREGKDLVLPLSSSVTYGSSLAPLKTRTLPVLLPSHLAPSHQNRTIRIVAPPGFAWGELPPNGEANGGTSGSAKLEIARDAKDPRVLVVRRSVTFNDHLIGTDRYPAWRAWIQQVDALMHAEVRLVEAK